MKCQSSQLTSVTDTSEYPQSHSLFAYSPDGDLPAKLQRIVDDLPETAPKTLGQVVLDILKLSAAALSNKPVVIEISDDEDSHSQSSAADGYDAYDYEEDIVPQVETASLMAKLQQCVLLLSLVLGRPNPTFDRHFVDIVGTDYRPGLIRMNGDDFALSVSLPVVKLAEMIPPRALMAWDARLLSSPQYFSLLITGFRSNYPVLAADASYLPAVQRLGVQLSFKVGLCKQYKPSSEHVSEVVRKHGLIIEDAEDELRKQAELAMQQKWFDYDPDAEDPFDVPEPMGVPTEVDEVDDEQRFDRFSLSNSLETLMDQSFLKLVAIRRKYALGWASAELVLAQVEKFQMKEEDVIGLMGEVGIHCFLQSVITFSPLFRRSEKRKTTSALCVSRMLFHTIPFTAYHPRLIGICL